MSEGISTLPSAFLTTDQQSTFRDRIGSSGWVLIDTITFSSSTSEQVIDLDTYSSKFDDFVAILALNVDGATSETVSIDFSDDNGATYITGGYSSVSATTQTSSASQSIINDPSASKITLGNNTGSALNANITFSELLSSEVTGVDFTAIDRSSRSKITGCGFLNTTDIINAVRFECGAACTGTVRIYGVSK